MIWLLWAVLWFLFFLLLGLDLGSLAPAVGVVALVEGLLTAAVPAFLILSDEWRTGVVTAVIIAVIGSPPLVLLAIPVGRWLAAPTPSHPNPAAPAATTQPKESSHARSRVQR